MRFSVDEVRIQAYPQFQVTIIFSRFGVTQLTLELSKEYPQDDEEAIIARLVTLTREQMRKHDGHFMRGQHAKSTGCVEAEFVVGSSLPEELRKGVFARPGAIYRALIRFSNSQGTFERDAKGTGRGAAIKLLDVGDGDRAIEGQDGRSQDFLLVNHPVFPFSDPADYVAAIGRRGIPVIGGLAILAYLAIEDREALSIVRKITSKEVASPLDITYWSGSPYWLGDADGSIGRAVKYSIVPRSVRAESPADSNDDDYLYQAIVDHLAEREAVFDFKIQLQTDPDSMKIEDASSEWDEAVSVPKVAATVRIPQQDAAAIQATTRECEHLSFNPWHSLAEHRPMGGINRLRRAVYEASFAKRSSS